MRGSTAKSLCACLVLVALFLSSCGSATSSSNHITLTYWTHTSAPSNALEKKLIAQYEHLHPNITINYLNVDITDIPTKVTTALAGGSGPDLFNYPQTNMATLASRGLLAPIDYSAYGVKDKAAFDALYPASSLSGFSYNGVAYGIPHEVSSYVFWINKAEFKAAGLDPNKDFPKTWTDVANVGKLLTKKDNGRTTQEGIELKLPVAGVINFNAMAQQAGQSLFSSDGKTAYLNSPAAVKALQTMVNYTRVSKIADPSLDASGSSDLFGNGTAAMTTFGGSWEISGLQQNYPNVYKNYAVGNFPTFAGGSNIGANLYGFGLFVPKTSQQQTEAWKFARFLEDNSAAYFQDAGIWLGDKATLDGPATKAFPHWSTFQAAFTRGSFFPPVLNYTQDSDIILQAIQRSVENGQSPQASLDQAQSEVQQYL
ncbi:MAG TPA: ABC transporter substrate-binding protein [Ktedonobacteraceae bacterium]|jgi:multiple sugar transport system substrate-binding protein